jgi:hypothetical protein
MIDAAVPDFERVVERDGNFEAEAVTLPFRKVL